MLVDPKKNEFFKAAILFKTNSKLKVLDDVIFPRIKDRQILVKILFTSVCGSQLFEIYGKRGRDKFLPHMLGHEATGIAINVGKKVKRIKIGDKVFLSWIKNNYEKDCSRIFYKSKTYKKRKINSGNITTFSNYSVVSSNRVYKLPESINFISGCLLCCALPTGAGMVLNNDSKIDKKKILIVGLGGVGLSSLLTAIYKKYEEIYAVDNNSQKISYLKKKLKRHKIFYYNDIKELKHLNFDLIIESTGNAKVISASMKYLKNHGKLIFASHPKFGEKIKIDPYDLILGKKIYGSWGGDINFKKHLHLLIKIIKFFKKIENVFFKKFYKLEEINTAINDLKNGKIIRPIIKL